MQQNPSPIPRDVLEAPFPPEAIKTRPGAYGATLSYLEGHVIIGRLNQAFGGNWSFEVVTHEILDDEVLVLGRLRAESAGVVKMAFGSSRITRDDRSGKPVAIGDDLKAGATDALKKAATLLGVGLQLYGSQPEEPVQHVEEPVPTAEPRDGRNTRNSAPGHPEGASNGSGRITNKQISAVFAIARERRMSNSEVRDLSKDMFGKTLDYLTKAEGSSLIQHLLGQ